MSSSQAPRHSLRLTEDRIPADTAYPRALPALNRVLCVRAGHLTVRSGSPDAAVGPEVASRVLLDEPIEVPWA